MTPFKTQQEIWNYVAKGEKIISIINGNVYGFKGGILFNFTEDRDSDGLSFYEYSVWLPYVEPLKLEFDAEIFINWLGEKEDRYYLVLDKQINELHRIGNEGKKFKVKLEEIVGEG